MADLLLTVNQEVPTQKRWRPPAGGLPAFFLAPARLAVGSVVCKYDSSED